MKNNHHFTVLMTGTILILFFCTLHAQDSTKTDKKEPVTNHEQHFIDLDGDGYNDNAPDHDGDGIPNGLDPDWAKLREEKERRQRFVDLDGDGINDNLNMEEEEIIKGEGPNMHEQKNGSSLEKKSKEQQRTQQKKQKGKP